MQMLNTFKNLVEEFCCIDIIYAVISHDVIEKLTRISMSLVFVTGISNLKIFF
jgi:hypothetical protein